MIVAQAKGQPQPVPFSVRAGEPIMIEVTAADGRCYEIRFAVAVFQVFDRQAPGPTGLPTFDVRANVAMDVLAKEGT